MSAELRSGDRVETPEGPGVVRNFVRRGQTVVMVLVELDQGETLHDHPDLRPWRGYETNDLRPIEPRLV